VNPRTIRWQACVNFALLNLVALAVAPSAVLWLAGPVLLWWMALNAAYAYSLRDRGRSSRRIYGDRWVARYLTFGLAVPLLLAAALLVAGYNQNPRIWDFSVNDTAALFIAPAALFVLILSSSLVDWYYIRPRIDGVVGDPPCRSSGYKNWKVPTRLWYLHRGLATLAYFVFAFVIALVVMVMLVREHPPVAGVVGGVGGLASLFLILAGNYRSQIPAVAKFVLSPAHCLGDDLTYEAGKWGGRGFVLHVAVPVTKLVPLGDDGRPVDAKFVERKNSDLEEADLTSRQTVACDAACVKLNPECTVDCSHLDQRRHLLVF
jgi:hypothetical protein